jgi:hypothetical protein
MIIYFILAVLTHSGEVRAQAVGGQLNPTAPNPSCSGNLTGQVKLGRIKSVVEKYENGVNRVVILADHAFAGGQAISKSTEISFEIQREGCVGACSAMDRAKARHSVTCLNHSTLSLLTGKSLIFADLSNSAGAYQGTLLPDRCQISVQSLDSSGVVSGGLPGGCGLGDQF